jgi:TolB-like protein
VAVLVFESRSRDGNDLYLAEGLSEAITTRLGRISRLTVRSQAAARRFRAGAQSADVIGRALNAGYLVTGTVRRGGDRVRVSVELARSASGERVWGEQYDRVSNDVLRVEEEVSEAIAIAVAGRLAPAERARLNRIPTTNPAAYDHYLKGRFQLSRPRSADAMAIAWREFSAATALDPSYAEARAQLGAVGTIVQLRGYSIEGLTPDSALARGMRETATALRLDSSVAAAWINLSTYRAIQFPLTYVGVKNALERALALDSVDPQINYVAANWLARLGDLPRALRHYRRATEADPTNPQILLSLISAAWRLGLMAETLAAADSLVALDPALRAPIGLRALLRAEAGDTAGARGDLREAAARNGIAGPSEWLARLAVGDSAGVGRYLDGLRTRFEATQAFAAGIPVAAILAHLSDRGGAIDVLERCRPRTIDNGYELRWPLFSPLAAEPRFRALLTEMQAPAGSR